MTGNVLLDLALSLGGVVLLVGLARLLFGARPATLDRVAAPDRAPTPDRAAARAAAADRLAFDEPDFAPTDWLAGAGGALALNAAGEAALVVPLGDGLATRRVRLCDLRSRREGAVILIEAPDHAFSSLAVTAASEAEARRWAARLAQDA